MNSRTLASMTSRLVTLLAAAVMLISIAAPAHAAEAPTLAELATASQTASADVATATVGLAAHDARITAVRQHLAEVESRLPSNAAQQARAMATAFGAAFSPRMMERADSIASDEHSRVTLEAEIGRLTKQREPLEQELADARLRASVAAARLAAAQRDEDERVRVEAEQARIAQINAVGLFPVAGPHEYIDSWGFARSGHRQHKGTDIMAERGTPVVAVHDGYAEPGSNGLGGRTVWLTGDDGKRYYYAHLDTIAVGAGRVMTGQVLGTVGDSGDARGGPTHLHFEIHQPNAVDPFSYLQQMVR